MRSINVSYSKLKENNFYRAEYIELSNITFSTFSNNKDTTNNYQAYHTEPRPLGLKILCCNYFKNDCKNFIYSDYLLDIINCSFYENKIQNTYFDILFGRILVKGCYFDIQNPGTYGNIKIQERALAVYPVNHHLSSELCFAEQSLVFPPEKTPETIEEAIYKRNNEIGIIICLISSFSK